MRTLKNYLQWAIFPFSFEQFLEIFLSDKSPFHATRYRISAEWWHNGERVIILTGVNKVLLWFIYILINSELKNRNYLKLHKKLFNSLLIKYNVTDNYYNSHMKF